jgi:hypothetical protein
MTIAAGGQIYTLEGVGFSTNNQYQLEIDLFSPVSSLPPSRALKAMG